MSEFERNIAVNATADQVYRIVSNISNLAAVLPSVQFATIERDGRVRLQGVKDGHEFNVTGRVQAFDGDRRLVWTSENPDCVATLEVHSGDTSSAVCEVTIHVTFSEKFGPVQEETPAEWEESVLEHLGEALSSIRSLAEGRRRRAGGR